MNLRSGTVVGAHILRPEHRPAFEEGVAQLFLRWTALCLAVENQWGGQSSAQKADSLLQEVIQWFYSRKGDVHHGCPTAVEVNTNDTRMRIHEPYFRTHDLPPCTYH